MQQKLNLSHDGSHTVYSEKFEAHYHSVFGAIEESIHVFLSAGLFYKRRQNPGIISIFEMGFGTGLNAYLTLLEAQKYKLNIEYTTVESDPIDISLANELNYTSCLNLKDDYLSEMHNCSWNETHQLTDNFKFKKLHDKIENLDFPNLSYDIIYYDAFAPSCQSELWSFELHKKLFQQLKPKGILVTYCTQGQFKRNLKAAGYHLETLNGPGKKREMLRAIKL